MRRESDATTAVWRSRPDGADERWYIGEPPASRVMMSRCRWPTTRTRAWRIGESATGRVGLTSMAKSASGKGAFGDGGASGIGAALATELVAKGAEVWIADRQIS